MDPDSPISRVERTFWTVWYYITGAVNRFLRPEPPNTAGNDPNSFQQSAVDSEPADSGQPESDTSGGGVDEEQPLATASLLSSSRPVVAWELCTTEIDLGPAEESVQYKSQLSGGGESAASEEGEGTREEQFGQTGNDDAGLLAEDASAKEGEGGENGDRKLYTHGRGETPENDDYEGRAKMGSINLEDDTMSEDTEGSGRMGGAEEETKGAMTLDDDQKVDETTREDDKTHHEGEQDLETEDSEIKLCQMTDFRVEEDLDVHVEEEKVQREEADTEVMPKEAENSNDVLQLSSESENKYNEGTKKVDSQLSVCEELSENDRDVKGEPGLTVLDDAVQMILAKSVSEDAGQEHVMAHRSESDKAEEERGKEDEGTLDERVQGGEEEAADEEQEQEEHVKTVTEKSEDILTVHVTRNEEIVQDAEAELGTAEFTDEEKEDVAKDAEVQTKTRETDDADGAVTEEKSHLATTDILVDGRFFDEDQAEDKRLSSDEENNKERYMEIALTATSVTLKTESETGQEISGEVKNIPPGVCEGLVVVSKELNTPTCEETQEGVPEYNNELGPDENTTQRLLEVGDCKEMQATQLPEEVESKESESIQNSGTEADCLLVGEHMEEERESTEDIKKEKTEVLQLTDTGLPQETEKQLVEPVIEGSERLLEEEEGNLLDSSMKTGLEHSEVAFETDFGVTDVTEIGETQKELQDGTEELLVELEIDKGLSVSKDTAGDGRETMAAVTADDSHVIFAEETLKVLEVQDMTETSFFQEAVDAINSEQNSRETLEEEEITKSGFMKQSVETEPKLLEECTVEMEDAGIDMEESAEEEAEEEERQNRNEIAGMPAEQTTENNKDILSAESELSGPDESPETNNQPSDEALEISNEAVDESMTTESKPRDLTWMPTEATTMHVTESEGSYAEETSSSVSGCQDVIDEEILDLWLQTALCKDTHGMEQQQGPEPGQQTDTNTEPSSEEQGEVASVEAEKEKEQLVESNSGESGLVSDSEMSSSIAESGFLDQSVSEWGADHSETQLLISPTAESFQSISDTLTSLSESADISELSTQQPDSESQDRLVKEAAETRQSDLTEEESIAEIGCHPDSGVVSSEAGYLDQEWDKSQEKTDIEPVGPETESQKETDADILDLARRSDWKDTEEADVESKDEKTRIEVAPLEVTVSDTPDEVQHAESGCSRSGSEASLQEEIMSAETEDSTCTESEKLPNLDEPQPRSSEDIAESLHDINRDEVTEQPMTMSVDQTEVDASGLDFTAQRSRIAVKNPRVRPPKDPRSLLHMPSVDPTPTSRLPVRVPAGVPLGAMGMGIKLPGLGAGFPVLKKTRVEKEEPSSETPSQEPETTSEEKSDTPKQDEAQHKPKWMPPKHPGFGNPLMSELKTKLKKTTKE